MTSNAVRGYYDMMDEDDRRKDEAFRDVDMTPLIGAIASVEQDLLEPQTDSVHDERLEGTVRKARP